MSEQRATARRPTVEDPERERADWIQLLLEMAAKVTDWVSPDWSIRVIQKEMSDSVLGEYSAPSVLMQRELVRVMLEPVTRFAPGADGVVDLYLMPAFDDIATVYRVSGEWKMHYAFRGTRAVARIRKADALTFDGLGGSV